MHTQIILRVRDIVLALGLSRATIYRLAKSDPNFPRFIALSPRSVGVLKTDLDAWLEQRRQATAAKGIA